jgi:wyosine [tRNA(Phe)-imidazoG37] synthetase (radical SAM superfamily)
MRPDRIHLNTIARPPAEDFAAAVPMTRLEKLAGLFDPPALIAAGFSTNRSQKVKANEANILSMLKRRPCTIRQIEDAFDMHINEVSKTLGQLIQHNQICADLRNREVYYKCI